MIRILGYAIFLFMLVQATAYCQQDSLNMSLDKAFTFFQAGVAKNPKSPYANYGLAKSYYLAKNYRASTKICKKFIYKKNDYRCDFNVLYAMSLIALEEQDKAISMISYALEDFPDNCMLYYYRSIAYYKNSELSRAFNDAKKSVELKEEFYGSHLLLGLIMYEKNNDRNAAAPLYYALFRNIDAEWAEKVLFIIHSLLNYKHDRLMIPLKEYRFDIKGVEDVIDYYCSDYNFHDWRPADYNFIPITADYLKDIVNNLNNLDNCYYYFYSKLLQSPHMVTFGYYIMKPLKMKEVEEWYKNHSEDLSAFADWLEKTLEK
jgi:tetratricopeptide (TPR) repeat protein